MSEGCNLHGWALTTGCPGCHEAAVLSDPEVLEGLKIALDEARVWENTLLDGLDEVEEDAEWLRQNRWLLRRMDWLPYRVYEFKGYDETTLAVDWGPRQWSAPRRGPFRWLMRWVRV